MLYLQKVLQSKICILVFITSLIGSYFLIPKTAFYGNTILISLLFMITLATTITCVIRNIKEKIILARTYEGSVISIIATAVGLASLQVCGVGAPVCGAAVGVGILSSIFPYTTVSIISEHAELILIISILLQLISLYFMNCFKSIKIEKAKEKKRRGRKKKVHVKVQTKYLNKKY